MDELLKRQKEAKQKEYEASVLRAQKALEAKWEQQKQEAHEVYSLDIPQQSVRIQNGEKARHAIQLLKSFGIRGTYRISLEGGGQCKK